LKKRGRINAKEGKKSDFALVRAFVRIGGKLHGKRTSSLKEGGARRTEKRETLRRPGSGRGLRMNALSRKKETNLMPLQREGVGFTN